MKTVYRKGINLPKAKLMGLQLFYGERASVYEMVNELNQPNEGCTSVGVDAACAATVDIPKSVFEDMKVDITLMNGLTERDIYSTLGPRLAAASIKELTFRYHGSSVPEGEFRSPGFINLDVLKAYKAQRAQLFSLTKGFDGYNAEFSYLIKGYLPAQSFGMVWGASGSFKSFHAISWACCIATGKEWNGRKVKQSPVLYIAGEGGVGVPRRIFAWCQAHNNGVNPDDLYMLNHAVPVTDIDYANQLLDTVRQQEEETGKRFGLIILDTLARCFGAGDENRSEDMNRFIGACDRLKTELKSTVLIVHHSGKDDSKGARGSSSLKGACDFEFSIHRPDSGEMGLTLSTPKAKDDRQPAPQFFPLTERHIFTDSDGDNVTSLSVSLTGETPPADEYSDSPLTGTETAVYQAVRCRMTQGETTARAIVRDDLKVQGLNVSNFGRWVKGCIDKEVIVEREGCLYTCSSSSSVPYTPE